MTCQQIQPPATGFPLLPLCVLLPSPSLLPAQTGRNGHAWQQTPSAETAHVWQIQSQVLSSSEIQTWGFFFKVAKQPFCQAPLNLSQCRLSLKLSNTTPDLIFHTVPLDRRRLKECWNNAVYLTPLCVTQAWKLNLLLWNFVFSRSRFPMRMHHKNAFEIPILNHASLFWEYALILGLATIKILCFCIAGCWVCFFLIFKNWFPKKQFFLINFLQSQSVNVLQAAK